MQALLSPFTKFVGRRKLRHAEAPGECMIMQGELDFSSGISSEGYAKWVVGRQVAARELAKRIGLPLGHRGRFGCAAVFGSGVNSVSRKKLCPLRRRRFAS